MYPLLFIELYYTLIFSFWQLQKIRVPQGYSYFAGGDVQHRNFVNFSKCPKAFLCDLEKQKTGININATICDILKNKYFIDLEKNFVHEQGYSRNMANLRIIEKSFIGKVPIRYLTELQVDMFLRSITHYSNSTIGKVYLQLKLTFREAFNQHIQSITT